jgi:hypothetical protein
MARASRYVQKSSLTPPLVTCFAISALIHAVTHLLNALLPLHVAALGASKTQIGMLFSVVTVASTRWATRWPG